MKQIFCFASKVCSSVVKCISDAYGVFYLSKKPGALHIDSGDLKVKETYICQKGRTDSSDLPT